MANRFQSLPISQTEFPVLSPTPATSSSPSKKSTGWKKDPLPRKSKMTKRNMKTEVQNENCADLEENILGLLTGSEDEDNEHYLCQLCDHGEGDGQVHQFEPREGKWIECVVDSGAIHSVAKRGTFPGKIYPSAMSKLKKGYKCASNKRIPNEGEVEVKFVTNEGHKCGMKIQVANVERPLISTADLTAAGNTVALQETGGHILNNKTKRRIALVKKGNFYIFRMWVPNGRGFTRPGM